MEVAPRTLREVEFREKLRGYNQDDVDEFLERVAAGIEVLQERLRQASERAQRAEQRLTEAPPTDEDDTLRRTLVLAQRTADMAVKEAQDRASELLANAEAEARSMLAEAEESAKRITGDAEREIRVELSRLEEARAQLQADVEGLERHVETERSRVVGALSNALRWLEENFPSVDGGPGRRPSTTPAPSSSPAGSSTGREMDRDRLDTGRDGPSSPSMLGREGESRSERGSTRVDAGSRSALFDADQDDSLRSEAGNRPPTYRI
jgi:DivIVA domain-containing protein